MEGHRAQRASRSELAGNLYRIFIYAKPGHGDDAARALTFTALVASIIVIIVTNRSWSRGLFGILRTPNAAQWWVVLGTIGLLAVVLTVPFARSLFHVAPLRGPDVAINVTAGILCVSWFEVLKLLRRRLRKPVEAG